MDKITTAVKEHFKHSQKGGVRRLSRNKLVSAVETMTSTIIGSKDKVVLKGKVLTREQLSNAIEDKITELYF